MSTVTVYRVEALRGPRTGEGPYRASPSSIDEPGTYAGVSHILRHTEYPDDSHPLPMDDGLGYRNGDEFCAFTSVEQAKEWFCHDEIRLLCETGFYGLVSYEVPAEHVRHGGRQVLFKKEGVIDRRVLDHRTF